MATTFASLCGYSFPAHTSTAHVGPHFQEARLGLWPSTLGCPLHECPFNLLGAELPVVSHSFPYAYCLTLLGITNLLGQASGWIPWLLCLSSYTPCWIVPMNDTLLVLLELWFLSLGSCPAQMSSSLLECWYPSPGHALGFNALCSGDLLWQRQFVSFGLQHAPPDSTAHHSHLFPAHRQTDRQTDIEDENENWERGFDDSCLGTSMHDLPTMKALSPQQTACSVPLMSF